MVGWKLPLCASAKEKHQTKKTEKRAWEMLWSLKGLPHKQDGVGLISRTCVNGKAGLCSCYPRPGKH